MKKFIKESLKKICCPMARKWPIPWMKLRYYVRFGKKLNLRNPKNLNEKILFLSLKTDTTKWTDLTDKFKVREYVKKTIGDNYLVKLYGKWNNAKDIDFSKLPNKFVLKTNHGSGEIIIVKDKNKLNISETIRYFNKVIKRPYGEIEGGKHYWKIKPLIIAEELLENDKLSSIYSSSIIDYKIWCFNGKAFFIGVYTNRPETEVLIYDLNWKPYPQFYDKKRASNKLGSYIPKPLNFDLMISIAEKLANPFPCVRVDLYNINGRIYFGELTFTSNGGMMTNFTDEFLDKAGSLTNITNLIIN